MWLFLIFVAVPLIEIALFIQIGGLIGLWPTLAIVVITAFVGTAMMRAQGRLAMRELRQTFDEFRDPAEPLAHGAMILFAGALLLTPGFFTDTVGFLLLIPPVRVAVFHRLRERVQVHAAASGAQGGGPGAAPRRKPAREDVIEGDFEEVPPQGRKPGGTSGWTRH